MQISLTPELERAIADKVESGMYSDASDVLREAMRYLLLRDRTESRFLGGEPWTIESLRAAVAVGAEEIERGEFADETIPDIIAEMERRYKGNI